MDMQLLVKRSKRPKTQTLALVATLLRRHQNYVNDLVEIFHDLRDEIINFKNMIKKLQDENPQLKETIANLQHSHNS